MEHRGSQPAFGPDIHELLREGRARAQDGSQAEARKAFARVLEVDPNHVEALLYQASLAPDPQESVRYLDRVLELSPGNPRALAGMRWARRRLRAQARAGDSGRTRLPLLDRLLLAGIVLLAVATVVVFSMLLWEGPRSVLAAMLPTATPDGAPPVRTPTPTVTSTPTPGPEPTGTPTPVPATATPTATPSPAAKRIEIDLSEQRLTAFEGDEAVLSSLVSTGLDWFPTPLGQFAIYQKIRSQTMSGPGYSVPNVEFASYFHRNYAIHGTYWHNNFGRQMSHGCVNMTNDDAEFLYTWAPIGTPVIVIP